MLVETSHPGNIGAVARALKNMSLEELVLVRPVHFPHPEASARASGAEDLLTRVRVEPTLEAALEGCGLVLATTSRERDQYFQVLDVRAAAVRAVEAARQAPVALVFGSERTGLTNRELEAAHALVRIPANPIYPSLNLAMAVQIVSYELLQARLAQQPQALPQSGPRRGAAGHTAADAGAVCASRLGARGDRLSRSHAQWHASDAALAAAVSARGAGRE